MDADDKDSNSRKVKPLGGKRGEGDDDDESDALLPPQKEEISRISEKGQRKVQWNDKNGNKLAEVVEFQPSDESESDEEEYDSCICTIM